KEDVQNPTVTGVVPKGYMTLEKFRNIEIEKTKLFCIENDIYSARYGFMQRHAKAKPEAIQ
ncbi:MAG: hypothetical protein LBG77_06455, partial [Dysgonamonadaceae bacterium]|nr:hypothetical protein [Dysgonamonadaceae bacterium]